MDRASLDTVTSLVVRGHGEAPVANLVQFAPAEPNLE